MVDLLAPRRHRLDLRLLRQDQGDQVILAERQEGVASHGYRESEAA